MPKFFLDNLHILGNRDPIVEKSRYLGGIYVKGKEISAEFASP